MHMTVTSEANLRVTHFVYLRPSGHKTDFKPDSLHSANVLRFQWEDCRGGSEVQKLLDFSEELISANLKRDVSLAKCESNITYVCDSMFKIRGKMLHKSSWDRIRK